MTLMEIFKDVVRDINKEGEIMDKARLEDAMKMAIASNPNIDIANQEVPPEGVPIVRAWFLALVSSVFTEARANPDKFFAERDKVMSEDAAKN